MRVQPAKSASGLLADETAYRDGVAPLLPQPRLSEPAQQRYARPVMVGLDEVGIAVEFSWAVGLRKSAHSTSFCVTGSLIAAASAAASLNLCCRSSSIACFVAARSGASCGADAKLLAVGWALGRGISVRRHVLSASLQAENGLCDAPPWLPYSGAAEHACGLAWKTR